MSAEAGTPMTEAELENVRIMLKSGPPPHFTDGVVIRLLATIDRAAGTLDEAWAAAEAALPSGWQLARVDSSGDEWTASAEPHPAYKPYYSATFGSGTMWLGKGATGSTPAAALLALADVLRVVPA